MDPLDMNDKVVLLTGGTEGIGKAAAAALVRRGATVVIVGRNAEKTARVVEELRPHGAAHSIVADLSVLAGIRAAAGAFRERYRRLDVLGNNAGAVFTEYAETADGFERTFALNHLSYFLLTFELRELLLTTEGARIISTSSGAHHRARFDDVEALPRPPDRTTGFPAYCNSKLANILFTRELARRLDGTGVCANCFHPGFVRSGFGHNGAWWMSWGVGLLSRITGRSPEKGAETLVWLATDPEGGRQSGAYFQDEQVAETAPRAQDPELARRLWDLSERLCGVSW